MILPAQCRDCGVTFDWSQFSEAGLQHAGLEPGSWSCACGADLRLEGDVELAYCDACKDFTLTIYLSAVPDGPGRCGNCGTGRRSPVIEGRPGGWERKTARQAVRHEG